MPELDTVRDILARYNQAIIEKSADRLADLYAEDARHETPFNHSDASTLRGRDAIRSTYAAAWGAAPVRVRSIDNVVLHRADDGETYIVEEDIALTNTTTGADFTASTVLVMHIEAGRIVHIRDYTDNLTIARGLGRVPAIASGE